MENDLELPQEYFETNTNELLEEDISNEELLSLDVVTPIIKENKLNEEDQANKLPFLNIPKKQVSESSSVIPGIIPETSTAQQPLNTQIPFAPKVEKTTIVQQQPNLQGPDINDNLQSRPTLDDNTILDEISKIEEKINTLETELKNIAFEEKNNFDNVINQSDNTDSGDSDSIVEVYSNNNTVQKQYIQRDINLLKKQKDKLLNEQQKRANTPYPIIDNTQFVPNFSPENVNDKIDPALNKSLEVENFLSDGSDNPKVVNDPTLGNVVISESQGTLDNAINDHGGLDNAIKDSINNQNNFTQIAPSIDSSPDSGLAVVGVAQKILDTVTSISSQLKEISGSLKGINNQSNTARGNNSFKQEKVKTDNAQSVAQPNISAGNERKSFEPIKNVKGDLPNTSDFPTGFDLTQLKGSSLLTRT